jgi:hypothetical protein
MGSETVSEVDVLDDQALTAIESKIRRSEYKIDALLDRKKKESKWDFQNDDANEYRRRMLPFYLLEKESNEYPVYITNNDLKIKMSECKKVKNFKLCKVTVDLKDAESIF